MSGRWLKAWFSSLSHLTNSWRFFYFWANKFLMIPRKSQYPKLTQVFPPWNIWSGPRDTSRSSGRPRAPARKAVPRSCLHWGTRRRGSRSWGGSQERLDMPKAAWMRRNGAWCHLPRGVALNTHSGFCWPLWSSYFSHETRMMMIRRGKKKKGRYLLYLLCGISVMMKWKCPYHAWDQNFHINGSDC